jgi:hypothetical protein
MKNRRSLNSYKNNRKYVGPSPFFLIVCKGEITEPDYFRSFPYYSKLGKSDIYGFRHSCGSVYIVEKAGQHRALVKNA